MTRNIYAWSDIEASAVVSLFRIEEKTSEAHAIIQIDDAEELFSSQLARLLEAFERLMQLPKMQELTPVFKRFFLTDAVNQAKLLPKEEGSCCASNIQQQPLTGGKCAMWIYLQSHANMSCKDDFTIIKRNGYEHIWQMGKTDNGVDSYEQTQNLLIDYEKKLNNIGASVAENCLRTWFFVRDVDIQYKALVRARREFFDSIGLTTDTHYIASTGIGGQPSERTAIHQLDTYAVKGIKPEQITYLKAADNMNRTSDYGVTFERGTRVKYGDRSHLIISGTASIDNKGQVVYEGDIVKQTHRMWQNVEALLKEGQQSWDDVMQIIVYLRDIADRDVVKAMFSEKFPDVPFLITLAPVCRPEWLIEMECMTVKAENNKDFRDF